MTKLGEAHDHCRERFKKALFFDEHDEHRQPKFIVVDNCNLETKYVAYYVDLMHEKNNAIDEDDDKWTWFLLSPNTDWKDDPVECASKTKHKVPLKTIQNMKSKRTLYDETDVDHHRGRRF